MDAAEPTGLRVEIDGGVATLWIDRAEKRNSFTYAMWREVPELLASLETDERVRVLVVRGAGDSAFSAGGDIEEFQRVRSTTETARNYTQASEGAEAALAEFPKPTIAMVHGWCVGGGCEVAVACDFRICEPGARFSIAQAKLGLLYGVRPTKRLVDVVGAPVAKYILYSGEVLDAAEALRVGLVHRVAAREALEQAVYDFAATLSSRAQLPVRGSKLIIQEILDGRTEPSERVEQLMHDSYESDDYREGVRAFVERRAPRFS